MSGRKGFNPRALQPWHLDVARLVAGGAKVREAAAAVGKTERMTFYALAAVRDYSVADVPGRPTVPSGRRDRSPTSRESSDAHQARLAALVARLEGRR
jgi:hypothetical protein